MSQDAGSAVPATVAAPVGKAPTRHILCMKWGTKYGPEYVNRLYAMVRGHLSGDFRFVCPTRATTATPNADPKPDADTNTDADPNTDSYGHGEANQSHLKCDAPSRKYCQLSVERIFY